MGTNYYARIDVCPHCGHPKEELHIGKSSAGWCFGLHVISEKGLNSLEDWESLLSKVEVQIFDEYGERKSLADFLLTVTAREWSGMHKMSESQLRDNHAAYGVNGLLRRVVDGRHCIGHGEGTWDLIPGEFS